ncbi:tigger transposable element-derived protein 1-like [Macrobrachium rosenbergii]|uniref:tigger transposable element-derived protein 1-like n=1 Tax=Macrobrachium rosenbergii TaxID=79674 RepID=UPI0034D78581
MSAKHPSVSRAGSAKKKRQSITLEQKMKIINQRAAGKPVMVIARDEHLSQSTVSTILKDEKRIMNAIRASASVHSTLISKKRIGPLEEMEQLLVTWMEDQIQKRMPLSLLTIQTKARMLFDELKKNYDDNHNKSFVASAGWFHRFKNHHNFHSVKISGEAASADAEGAAKFKDILQKIVIDEGYLPEQIFNVDETGLYWKRMPQRSYIHKEATMMPGFKAYKDRLTLLLGGNVAGYKLKPLMIYHSKNPRALKRIDKHTLPVHYRHNKKAWMAAMLFEDWFVRCFIPEVKDYCRENKIPFKILLILDNAPDHPQNIGDINENVKVVFLPPNTTSLIQPMDQGAVATFKAYYLRNTLDLEIDEEDIQDLLDVKDVELTAEDLIALAEERKRADEEEEIEEEPERKFTTKALAEVYNMD